MYVSGNKNQRMSTKPAASSAFPSNCTSEILSILHAAQVSRHSRLTCKLASSYTFRSQYSRRPKDVLYKPLQYQSTIQPAVERFDRYNELVASQAN
jgi:hypothetical protein